MNLLSVTAAAKVNLTLEVLGRRPDGYHALRSVVLPVTLADTLDFAPATAFATDTGYPDDLVLKAARVLRAAVQDAGRPAATLPAYAVRVTKRIPAGGGLGGGSADAAATLRALNGLWRLGWTPEALAALGADVGSDVPALVLAQSRGVPVLMEGRGETVSALPGLGHPLSLVLVLPGVPCSTAEVYARCTPGSRPGATDAMCAALAAGDGLAAARALQNDLEAPACAIRPRVAEALEALRRTGALGVRMSGSGSTVFGLAASPDHAQALAAALVHDGWNAQAASSLTI